MGWDGMGDENPTKWKCWERNIESINFPKQINKQINNFTHIHITLEKMKKKKFFVFVFFSLFIFLPNLEIGKRGFCSKNEEERRRKKKGISKKTAKKNQKITQIGYPIGWFQGRL